MMKGAPHAVFRLDVGLSIGMGHLIRCYALAAAFVDDGWNVDFAVNAESCETVFALAGKRPLVVPSGVNGARAMTSNWPEGVELLVVDHYGLDAVFENACRPWAKIIAVIDDMTNRMHSCDLLLNPSPVVVAADYGATTPDGCRFLLGARYALLRPQFLSGRKEIHPQPPIVDRLLITMGGSDPENLTERAVEALRLLSTIPQTRIILGSAYAFDEQLKDSVNGLSDRISVYENVDDMAAHMAWSDIAISTAGSTTWELCAIGVPALYIQTAENQNAVVRAIEAYDVGMVLGLAVDITAKDIAAAIEALRNNQERRVQYAAHGRALVDGQGTRRIVEKITL